MLRATSDWRSIFPSVDVPLGDMRQGTIPNGTFPKSHCF